MGTHHSLFLDNPGHEYDMERPELKRNLKMMEHSKNRFTFTTVYNTHQLQRRKVKL